MRLALSVLPMVVLVSAVGVRAADRGASRPNIVLVTAPYPGATPQEVEKGLALPIEKAVKDLEDVSKLTTIIGEGLATCILDGGLLPP